MYRPQLSKNAPSPSGSISSACSAKKNAPPRFQIGRQNPNQDPNQEYKSPPLPPRTYQTSSYYQKRAFLRQLPSSQSQDIHKFRMDFLFNKNPKMAKQLESAIFVLEVYFMSMKTPPKNFQELQNYLYEMRTCLENLALNLTQEQREREAHLRQVQVQKAKESGVALPSGYESYERYYKDHPPFLLQRGLYDDQTLRSLSSLEKTFDETSRYLVEIKEDDTLNMVSQKLRKAQAIARDGDTISSDRQEIS